MPRSSALHVFISIKHAPNRFTSSLKKMRKEFRGLPQTRITSWTLKFTVSEKKLFRMNAIYTNSFVTSLWTFEWIQIVVLSTWNSNRGNDKFKCRFVLKVKEHLPCSSNSDCVCQKTVPWFFATKGTTYGSKSTFTNKDNCTFQFVKFSELESKPVFFFCLFSICLLY